MKISADMEQVLKNIGWDSGFRLPLANDENQQLEKEMAMLVLRKASALKELDDTTNKFNSLSNHLKYVKQESQQNQNLLTTYRTQLESETHGLKLSQVEKDKINSEVKQTHKNINDIEERDAGKRIVLAQSVQKLEKIKAEVMWDAEATKAWEDSLKKRDEDNEILKKFSIEDQHKALELEAKRKNLQMEVNERKTMLKKMEVDIINSEQVLTRTDKILTQMKEERLTLVTQWQEAVKNLRNRDEDIKRANKDLENRHEEIRELREKLKDEESFLKGEINNNKYLEIEIQEKNFTTSLLKRDLLAIRNELALYNNEVLSKKNQVEAMAHALEKQHFETRNLHTEKVEKSKMIVILEAEVMQLTKQHNDIKTRTMNAADNTQDLERFINTLQKREFKFNIDIATSETAVYKLQQTLAQIKEQTHSKEIEFESYKKTLTIIRKRFKQAKVRLDDRKQIISNLELKVACLEAKLGNIEGATFYEEDIEIWNEKIRELEGVLLEQTEIKQMLHLQLTQLQKETLRLVKCTSNDNKVLLALRDKLQSFVLMIEGGIKQATAAKLRTQQLQVEENVSRLRVDKLNKTMTRQDKEIYNLQKYKLELETVLKERQIEVLAAKDILFAKKKNLDEDCGRLRADISLRNVRIEQLQNIYELAVGSLGRDECGNQMSMATYKVKTAQEKYLLQQEGDALDQKVRKAESEIVAMENTLKVVNMTNVSFKVSLETIDTDGDEAKELKELEFVLKDRNTILREKQKILSEKNNECRKLQQLLEAKQKEYENVLLMLGGKEEIKKKMEKDEEERQEKISRTDKHINIYKKNISAEQIEKYDREISIRQFQDVRKNCLHKLADLSNEFPEVAPPIKRYFSEFSMEMPRARSSFNTPSSDSVRTPSTLASETKSTPNLCSISNVELNFDEPTKQSASSKTPSKKTTKASKRY